MKQFYKRPGVAFGLASVLSMLLIMAVWYKAGICFETNDDRSIAEILCGVQAAGPQARTVHVNFWLGALLSGLYTVTTTVPWYGICMIGFHFLVYAGLFYCAFRYVDDIKMTIVSCVAICGFFVSNLYLLGAIQFTSAAAMLAGAGYVCLLMSGGTAAGVACFVGMELLAYFMRGDSMLMIQPYGAVIWLGWLFGTKAHDIAFVKKKIVVWGACVLAVLCIGRLGFLAGYGEEWDRFYAFNESRVKMVDYYGIPPYEEVVPILEKYDVTEAEYRALSYYCIMDWDVSPECAAELAAYAEAAGPAKPELAQIAADYWDMSIRDAYLKSNLPMLAAWVIMALWIVVAKRWKLLMTAAGLLGARMVVWGYVLWNGRTPMRVLMPLLACEALLVLAAGWKDAVCAGEFCQAETASAESTFVESVDAKRKAYRVSARQAVLLVALICFCGVCFYTGRTQYRFVKQENEGQKVYMEGLREVQEYCDARPEHKYVLEAISFCYYKGSALETETYQQHNCVIAGNWYANSPPKMEKLKDYLGTDCDELYLIVFDDGQGETHPALRYLAEKMDAEPVCEDYLTASHGGSYLIWKLKRTT